MRTFLLASILLAPLSLVSAASSANESTEFTMAIISDPQYGWTCNDEIGRLSCKDAESCKTEIPYCKFAADKKIGDTSKHSNEIAYQKIKEIARNSIVFRGLIINGDLTNTAKEGQRNDFTKNYKVTKNNYFNPEDNFIVYPSLGDHDYEKYIGHKFSGKVTYNTESGGMMHLMADWILGYKGLDKNSRVPRDDAKVCGKNVQRCHINAFNINSHQSGGNRNINGSLAYSWQTNDFVFIQLQNYPHYTTNFKRGFNSGFSSWTMNVTPSTDWLELQLARNKDKKIIINWHNHDVYRDSYINSQYVNDKDKSKFRENKKDLEDILGRYNNILAIFVGHQHHIIGSRQGSELFANIPVIYSGSPIAGQFVKATFNNKNGNCITLHKVMTFENKQEPLNLLKTKDSTKPRNVIGC